MAAQIVAGAAIVMLGVIGPSWSSTVGVSGTVPGIGIGGVGLALAAWGIVSLGPSLTSFPRPAEGATFRDEGAYRIVRHPIYAGLLLLAAGWSLVRSPLALVATVLLVVVLELKSRHEESMLLATYPEYSTYRERVRWRFLPGLR